MTDLTDAERISRWFQVADRAEDYTPDGLAIHLKDAALRCEQLMHAHASCLTDQEAFDWGKHHGQVARELADAKASLREWLEGSRGPFSLQEHDIRERIRKILGEPSLLRQAAAGFAAVGCPACGVHEPDQCTCSQAERAAAQAKLDGRGPVPGCPARPACREPGECICSQDEERRR